MSSLAETRISDIVLIFLVHYILFKMKASWIETVVLQFYQQEAKKKNQKTKTSRMMVATWEIENITGCNERRTIGFGKVD